MMTRYEEIEFNKLTALLKESGIEYEDTTWGNDATASISVLLERSSEFEDVGLDIFWDEELQIYIPNSHEHDAENEKYNTFAVTLIEQGHTTDFRRAEEVMEYLKGFTN
jgi:hypothetical protein